MDATKFPPKTRRTLTEEQLGKKRRIDKIKHRENRAESKTRLENIERDVSFLRDTIGDLLQQMRQLSNTADDRSGGASPLQTHAQTPTASHAPPPPPLHISHPHTLPSNQLLSLPKPEPWNSPQTTPPTMQHVDPAFYNPADHLTERLFTQHVFPPEPVEAQMDMEALLADLHGHGSVVECRCGKQHHSDAQCTERITVILAVELNKACNNTSLRNMSAPRDPSLTEMLLHHTDMSNPLSAVLSLILRQYETTDVNSLCGIFFLGYRLLRWRYYPSPESMADVPVIMRPTQSQVTIPHPKCVDFLPFPALRNFLCLNQHQDARHSVDLYVRSLRLILPPGTSLMAKTERGSVGLHPGFETAVADLRNWRMGPPWSDEFPHLNQFLY